MPFPCSAICNSIATSATPVDSAEPRSGLFRRPSGGSVFGSGPSIIPIRNDWLGSTACSFMLSARVFRLSPSRWSPELEERGGQAKEGSGNSPPGSQAKPISGKLPVHENLPPPSKHSPASIKQRVHFSSPSSPHRRRYGAERSSWLGLPAATSPCCRTLWNVSGMLGPSSARGPTNCWSNYPPPVGCRAGIALLARSPPPTSVRPAGHLA
jgi:hypothetical protein